MASNVTPLLCRRPSLRSQLSRSLTRLARLMKRHSKGYPSKQRQCSGSSPKLAEAGIQSARIVDIGCGTGKPVHAGRSRRLATMFLGSTFRAP